MLLKLTSRTGAGMSARYPSAVFFNPDEYQRQMRATRWQFVRMLSDTPTHTTVSHPVGAEPLESPVEA